MRVLWLIVAGALLAAVGEARASSCVEENACVCPTTALTVADVEVTAVEGPRTTVRVNAVATGTLPETLQLARGVGDAVGQRRLLYFDQQRSLELELEVINGSVTCPQPSGPFVLTAEDAFRFASDPDTCFAQMIDAGMPPVNGCGGSGANSGSCASVPGSLAALGAMLCLPLLLGRRRGRHTRASAAS